MLELHFFKGGQIKQRVFQSWEMNEGGQVETLEWLGSGKLDEWLNREMDQIGRIDEKGGRIEEDGRIGKGGRIDKVERWKRAVGLEGAVGSKKKRSD